jgi:hypothetical protein
MDDWLKFLQILLIPGVTFIVKIMVDQYKFNARLADLGNKLNLMAESSARKQDRIYEAIETLTKSRLEHSDELKAIRTVLRGHSERLAQIERRLGIKGTD